MTSRETCLICFVQNGAQFWKYLWDCFGLSTWKLRKKLSRSYLRTGKIEKGKQKEFLITWESLNYNKCLQQLPSHSVSSLPETRCFANVFVIILVWARKDVEKLFEETVCQYNKEKRRRRDESSDWDLKNALTNTNLRTVKRYKVGMCIGLFSFLNIVMSCIDLARAKSEAPDNIYSLLKQDIKSCNAKRRRQRERTKNNNSSN